MINKKVIVAHPGKQHVNQLLISLVKSQRLSLFITFIAFNKTWAKLPFLKKRTFQGIPSSQIKHYPLIWIFLKLIKTDLFLFNYRFFDKLTIKQLNKNQAGIVIGYENSNKELFKKAKQLKILTILDLAAVHHFHYQELYEKHYAYRAIYKSRTYFEEINKYKEDALNYTDYCFCLSTYAQKTLFDAGFRKDQVFITNLGTNLDLFRPKKSYSLSFQNSFRLLYVGRLSALKGIGDLISIMKTLERTEPKIHLTLIGPQDKEEVIIKELPSNVSIHPFLPQDKLVENYQAADVFINYSYSDSWAQTVIEAMACGTPAIVTENTGSKDAVKRGGGWIVPVNNNQKLQELLLHLANSSEEVKRKGKKAHEIAQEYTWNQYHASIEKALDQILSKGIQK